MKPIVSIILLLSITTILNAQCPDGPRPTFWHPNQIDSFKTLYPNCEKFNFQTTMINGEYVKPKTGNTKDKILYLICLGTILGVIIFCLRIITLKVDYFKTDRMNTPNNK